MDNLEQIITSQREAFDDKEPREKLWERIEFEMDKPQQNLSWLWKAAVIVLVALCGFLLWERGENQAYVDQLVELDPEFEETEMYYSKLISEKQLIIENFQIDDPALKVSFKNDMASLDSMYTELKTEFIETNNTAVIDAMIYNLQLRMELLNQQLMILEKIEQRNNEEFSVINS